MHHPRLQIKSLNPPLQASIAGEQERRWFLHSRLAQESRDGNLFPFDCVTVSDAERGPIK